MRNASWSEKYVFSLFYSVATMLTVGFIEPSSSFERLISVFIMLILSGGFAYSINSIGIIVQEMFKSDTELKLN